MPLPLFLAPLALKLSPVGRLLKKVPTWAWIALGVALILFAGWRWHVGEVNDAYEQGVTDQKAAQARQIVADKLEQARREKLATDALARAVATDTARIATNRKDVDDAARNIPDQAPSARQLVRACVELRRQGQNPPACQHIPPAKPATAPR